MSRRVLILGAAGRDFHDFQTAFRDDPDVTVVGFTATQIPGIDDRRYPSALGGSRYPEGLPIWSEEELEDVIKEQRVDECVFSYSDVDYPTIGHLAARAAAAGADTRLMSPDRTMLEATVPVIAVTAVRTGCGKSPCSRYVSRILREAGHTVAVVRHPMPYGDLAQQAVQRFETLQDLADANCTFEEREEYEAHIEEGSVVFAGVDFAGILAKASEEADVVLWDGGNNDVPFYKPDLWITLVDPLRPGHETRFHPGEINLRRADVIVVPKVDVAKPADIAAVEANAMKANPRAPIVRASSPLTVDIPHAVAGKRVLCIEDGPTTTHGGMGIGAAWQAAKALGAAEIVDPRPALTGSLIDVFERYPHLRQVLPAMGYFPEQIRDLQSTIAAVDCDLVLIGTPLDLTRLLDVPQPTMRVRYAFDPENGALKQRVLATVALAVTA